MIVLDMVVVFLVSSYIFFSSSLLIFVASGSDLLLLAVDSAWLHHHALGQLLLGLSEPPVGVVVVVLHGRPLLHDILPGDLEGCC